MTATILQVTKERAEMHYQRLASTVITLVGLSLAPALGAGPMTELAQQGELPQEVLTLGQKVYAEYCSSCHGVDGEGRVGPALINSARLSLQTEVITQVLRGSMYMPSFASKLDDQQIASVVTYIRNSFDNSFGLTSPDDVAGQR